MHAHLRTGYVYTFFVLLILLDTCTRARVHAYVRTNWVNTQKCLLSPIPATLSP
jgi:hypothetical protein